MTADCGNGQAGEERPATFPSLEAALHLVDRIHLEEVPGDTIAQIGLVDNLPNGKILLGNRYLPRVRLYDASGRFMAAQGRFGEGPFEYQRIQGVAAASEGRVFVEGFRAGHGTLLTPMLEPDTALGLPGGSIASEFEARFRDGVVRSGLWREGPGSTSEPPMDPNHGASPPGPSGSGRSHTGLASRTSIGRKCVTASSWPTPCSIR